MMSVQATSLQRFDNCLIHRVKRWKTVKYVILASKVENWKIWWNHRMHSKKMLGTAKKLTLGTKFLGRGLLLVETKFLGQSSTFICIDIIVGLF